MSSFFYLSFNNVISLYLFNLYNFFRKESDRTCTNSTEFYKVIITPRNQWSTFDYGWLTNMVTLLVIVLVFFLVLNSLNVIHLF